MKLETRDPWRSIVGMLGAVLTATGIVVMIIQRRRPIPAGIEGRTTKERATAELDVDDTALPSVAPVLKATLNLASEERMPLKRVCIAWNEGRDQVCAHVANLVTQSYVLSRAHPQVTYVFDQPDPVTLAQAIRAKDLSLDVYPAGEDQPIHPKARKALLRHLRRWLTALDAYRSVDTASELRRAA
jgi:hypothetical protein